MRSAGRATEVAIRSPIRDPGGGPLPARFNLEAGLDGRRLTVHHRADDRIARSDLTATGAGDDIGFATGMLGPGDAVSTTLADRPTGPVRVIYSVPESDMSFVAAAVDPAPTN